MRSSPLLFVAAFVAVVAVCDLQASAMPFDQKVQGARPKQRGGPDAWSRFPASWGKRQWQAVIRSLDTPKGKWDALSGSWGKRSLEEEEEEEEQYPDFERQQIARLPWTGDYDAKEEERSGILQNFM